MDIRESTEGDVLVLAPEGSLAETDETSAVETRLGAAAKAKVRLVVFDCTGVGQLSSVAIRVLLMAMRKLDRVEGRLVLCGMNAKVHKAFVISGFDKDFTIVATREEALVRVREPGQPRPAKKVKARAATDAEAVSAPVVDAAPAPAEPEPVPVATVSAPAAPVTPAEPVTAAVALPRPAGPIGETARTEPALPVLVPAPAKDYDGLAAALLNGLGMKAARARPEVSGALLSDADSVAAGVLAALRVGSAGRSGI